jgi:peptidoglycan/LPS O-acetylase OafA/YrhL
MYGVAATHEQTDMAARLSHQQNAFDFLRLVAATIVVIQHANVAFGTDFGWGIAGKFDGVAIFFVMSGMLIYLSADRVYERTGQWRQFYLNRFLRIAPAIYAFTLVVPVTLLAVGAISLGETLVPKELAAWVGGNLLLLPSYEMPAWSDVGLGAMTWPLYTIPAEVSFYIVTPLLVLAARRWGFWAMLGPFIALGVAGAVAFQVLSPEGLGPDNSTLSKLLSHTFVHRGFAFAAGIFWAVYWPRVTLRWWLTVAAAGLYAALATAGSDVLPSSATVLLKVAAISYLVMVVGYCGPHFLSRMTETVGDLSFGTYVYHYLVINLLLWYGHAGSWWNTPAAILGAWLVAAVSWRVVERPALKLKRVSLRGDGAASSG